MTTDHARIRRHRLIFSAGCVIAHEILVPLAASQNVAVALFSPGSHTPTGLVLLLVALMMTRLLTFLVVPGFLLMEAGTWLYDRKYGFTVESK